MAYLFEVPVEGADPVIVEIAEDEDGIVRAARPGEIAGRAAESLQAALDRIRPMAKAFAERTEKPPEGPDEVCVQFGFKLTAEAGFVVAKATGEANFQVSFTWKHS
ncbi:CU044_2847 family protein [Actinoallomurus sp. CA-150999]|uniref:CU044_2847 family protein n=1 Tax=Actinoallomurus sp. CA-150999 TaxID=3239887 RepID=UPI003D9337CF